MVEGVTTVFQKSMLFFLFAYYVHGLQQRASPFWLLLYFAQYHLQSFLIFLFFVPSSSSSPSPVGIPVFGPSVKAARMEGSKTFSKDFMKKHNIPTAAYENFTDAAKAKEFIQKNDFNVVLKASGLAAGKGVLIPTTKEEACQGVDQILVEKVFGAAGMYSFSFWTWILIWDTSYRWKEDLDQLARTVVRPTLSTIIDHLTMTANNPEHTTTIITADNHDSIEQFL